jgi:microcystin-dependent protein
MVSTFTPNIQIEEPARGDDVGTWDTPVNSNMTLLDLVAGGIATISGTAGSVVLSAAQFRSKGITINSTLLASITLTFPTSFTKSYEIQNLCTGSSAFVVQLLTTAAGGQVVAVPPGEIVDVVNDGTNLKFKNLGRIGSYWDYAGSSVPNWVQNCTINPYLNCDGTTFSSATYPALANLLGTTTLPDSRGQVRANLNQGTGRLQNGANGNILFSFGGTDTQTLTVGQIPNGLVGNNSNSPVFTGTQTGGFTPVSNVDPGSNNIASGGANVLGINPNNRSGSLVQVNTTIGSGSVAVQITNSGGQAHLNVQPTYVGGLTLIRAA